ncbi:hypothetical protein [Treponema zioleckii]|uniref:hypothetical protein n=1 Tax=Treponema zioleckii TaxID=331680 RepID=UPI00168B44FC|nr:hypothetical protein [Treponema zioleckii]
MTIRRLFLLFFSSFSVFLIFISCSNLSEEKGTYLVFAQNSRAAEKEVSNLTSITLHGNSSDEKLSCTWKTWSEVVSSKIELSAGDWEFTLAAKLDSDTYSATTTAKIKAGKENVVSFSLKKMDSDSDATSLITLSPGGEDTPDSFDSISEAVKAMTDSDTDYTIYISGIFTGCQKIEFTDSVNAKSITLQGLDSAVLDGNSEGTTLTISTTVPVTLKNLTITGGKNEDAETGYGGGIFTAEGTSVKLADGTLVAGNSAYEGAGVYTNGKLFMYGTAVIGDSSKTEAATESSCANLAVNAGGGICISSSGMLYMGYSDEETPSELSGGVYYNAKDCGISAGGNVYMNSGFIAYNYGKGVSIWGGATVELSGGAIIGNYNPNAGGGVRLGYNSKLNFSGGTISGNTATYGGGIALDNNGIVVTMTGGSISGNTATEAGGGVSCGNASTSKFKMTGGSIIGNTAPSEKGANLYKKGATISVMGTDSNGTSVNISDTTDADIVLVN